MCMLTCVLVLSLTGQWTDGWMRQRECLGLCAQRYQCSLNISMKDFHTDRSVPVLAAYLWVYHESWIFATHMQCFPWPCSQLAMGMVVNFFFSGFVLGKVPFALSPRFKLMLQVRASAHACA